MTTLALPAHLVAATLDRLRRHLTTEVLLRVLADTLLVNVSLAVALLARLVAFTILRAGDDGAGFLLLRQFQESVHAYVNWAGLLVAVCLACFTLSGFYTYGRSYQSRYKALVVVRAVSLAYLAVGSLSLFLPIASDLSRSALLLSWVISAFLLVGARLWASSWRLVARRESLVHPEPARGIRTVLVIGGAGYIGSLLVRRLLDEGYSVRVLDTLIYGDRGLRDLLDRPRFQFTPGDFRDITCIVAAMRGIDAVVHLGAIVGDPACALDEGLTLDINVAATHMVAEVAKGAGVQRFLFASTCSVYGVSEHLLDERSDLTPVSLYAKSKIASERAVLRLDDERFAVTVLRFATLFGLSPRPRFDLVVNLLTAMAVREGRITVFDGGQWRPFLHVADAAEALARCLRARVEAVGGEVLNVGADGENYRIADVGALIAEAVPGAVVESRDGVVDRRNYRVSFRKWQERVGFTPRRTVREGIAEMKAALEQGLVEDFRDPVYSNHRTIAEEGTVSALRREDSWQRFVAP